MIGYTKIFTWEINSNVQGKIHLFRTNLYNILQNIINLCQFHWKLTMMTTACLIIWTLLIVLNTKFTFQVEDPSDLLRTSLYFFKWVTAFSFLINFRGQSPLISFYFILQISNLFQMIQIIYFMTNHRWKSIWSIRIKLDSWYCFFFVIWKYT